MDTKQVWEKIMQVFSKTLCTSTNASKSKWSFCKLEVQQRFQVLRNNKTSFKTMIKLNSSHSDKKSVRWFAYELIAKSAFQTVSPLQVENHFQTFRNERKKLTVWVLRTQTMKKFHIHKWTKCIQRWSSLTLLLECRSVSEWLLRHKLCLRELLCDS